MSRENKKRFWEVDFLRGLAIVLMIVFHAFFDLDYFGASEASAEVSELLARVDFGALKLGIGSGFWLFFARATAALFIVLSGISLTLSYSRTKAGKIRRELSMKFLKRGLRIFSWGLLVSAATWVYLREGFIVFGVLHFIGASIILTRPLLGRKRLTLVLALLAIAGGFIVDDIVVESPWLVWLGLAPTNFYSVDYFPMLPWFGVFLTGILLGESIYPNGKQRLSLPDLSHSPAIKHFCFLGRHSLFIYLLHQPLLILTLYLTGAIDYTLLIPSI